MASSTALRSASVASRKLLPERSTHSRSSQARPPRIRVWFFSRWGASASGSFMMKSMNSGTRASVALPDRASRGSTMSASSRTVAHSWALKNFGVKGPALAALPASFRACSCAVWAWASVRAKPGANGAEPRSFRIPRRPMSLMRLRSFRRSSQAALLPVIGDVLGRAHGQGEDGRAVVLVGVRDEGPRVGHEHVPGIVGLAPLVQDGGPGAVAHPGGPRLVDDLAARLDAEALLLGGHRGEDGAPDLLDDLAGHQVGVAHLLRLGVRPLPVETKDRDAPAVHHVGIQLAVAVLVGDHLAPGREADEGAVEPAVVVLQGLAVASAVDLVDGTHEPVARHVPPAPALEVVAARGVQLPVVEPPGHVHVHAPDAVFIEGRQALEARDLAGDAGARAVREVAADRPAGVREAVRVADRLRVEEEPEIGRAHV